MTVERILDWLADDDNDDVPEDGLTDVGLEIDAATVLNVVALDHPVALHF